MKNKKLLLSFIFLILGYQVFSQSTRWKRMRYEMFVGAGATNFLGELGGADHIGTDFVRDFEFAMTRPSFTYGMRYFIRRDLSAAGTFAYGWLRGADNRTNEPIRNNRNLQFRSPLAELSLRLEYALMTEKRGHRYSLKKVRGQSGNRFIPCVYAGLGLFWFNPRAKDINQLGTGKWYSLRKIGTEGQFVTTTRKPYPQVGISPQVGLYAKWLINRRWNIAIDLGARWTGTDYMDDVSTTYADPEKIAENTKYEDIPPELAKWFADPSLLQDNKTGINQQRGDARDDDSYMFGFITLCYRLKTGRDGWPIFKFGY